MVVVIVVVVLYGFSVYSVSAVLGVKSRLTF